MVNPSLGKVCEREPVSRIIVSRLEELAIMSEEVSARVEGRLRPILSLPSPVCEENKKIEQDTLPPLFDEMDKALRVIKNNLNAIEYTLSRTEL